MLKQFFFINPIIINSFLFLYFIVIPFLFVKNHNQYIVSFIIASMGYLAFTIGYKSKLKTIRFLQNEFKDTVLKRILFVVFLLIDINAIMVLFFGEISQNAYNISYLESSGQNSLYLQMIYVAISFVKLYIYSGYLKNNKKLFFLVFLITLFATFGSRVRFDVIKVVIFFGIYGIYYKYIKLTIIKAIVALVFAPLGMLAFLIKRDFVGSVSINNLVTVVKETIENLYNNGNLLEMIKVSMESFKTFDIFNSVVKDNLITPINGIFRVFFNFIPRSIWDEKPYPLQIVLASKYNNNAYVAGGGEFANIYGDAYTNGGIFGVVIIMFVLGMIARSLFKGSFTELASKPLNIGVYSLFIVFFFNFYRGYLSDQTWQFILFILIFQMLNYFERLRLR